MSFFGALSTLALTLVSALSLAQPQPPEIDRLLVSFLGQGEGEVWLQGDFISDSLIPSEYGEENSGIDYSQSLQLGGRYGLSDLWGLNFSFGLHEDQAWRRGEPQIARSHYQSNRISLSRLIYSGNEVEISSHLGLRTHTADEIFEDAYSLSNTSLSNTTTAYARNNQLSIDKQQQEQITLDFSTHTISLKQNTGDDFTLIYRPSGDAFYISEYSSLLRIGNTSLSDSEYINSLGSLSSSINLASTTFPDRMNPAVDTLPLTDPSTPYNYLTHAQAYDKGVTAGLTTSFYPSSRLRYSLGFEYRQIEIAPQFSIHPNLISNTNQIADAAERMADFITSDTTDTSGNTNIDILLAQSAGTGTTSATFNNLAKLLDDGASSARDYLSQLNQQIPQENPWDEHHLLLSTSFDWWPYDDLGWAAEYTWYQISRSNYNSQQGKINRSIPDQSSNHQIDGWMFVKPTPDLTLYLHGRVYSNFLLGDRPLLYNARVNHRFDDPFGYISAGIVWQF